MAAPTLKPYSDPAKPYYKYAVWFDGPDESRKRKKFQTKKAAEAFLADKEVEYENLGKQVAANVTENLKRDAHNAKKLLEGLDGASLEAAAEHYARHLRATTKSAPIANLVTDFLAAKKAKSDRHRSDLKNRLATFATDFGTRYPTEVTTHELEEWLVKRPGSALTRNHWRSKLHSFFAWCRRKGRCLENPVAVIEKADVTPGVCEIYTPKEMKRLLRAVVDWKPERIVHHTASSTTADSEAWSKLCATAASDSPSARNARSAKLDVEQFYEADRYKLTGILMRVDGITGKQVHETLEQALDLILAESPDTRSSGSNELFDLELASATGALCEAIRNEKDLRVLARMTRALEKITGEKFSPLAREDVLQWWELNKTRTEFNFPKEDYLLGRQFFVRESPADEFWRAVNPVAAKVAIPHLEKVLSVEPKAAYSRYYLGLARLATGDDAGAERELSELSRSGNRRYWLEHMLRAIIAAHRGEEEKAITALNAAFAVSPGVAVAYARNTAMFRGFRDEEKVKWPLGKKTTSSEGDPDGE